MISKFFIIIFLLLYSSTSHAYLGMGPLIPAIGSAVIFVFVLILAFFGILFYPIKKLLEKRKRKKEDMKKNNNVS